MVPFLSSAARTLKYFWKPGAASGSNTGVAVSRATWPPAPVIWAPPPRIDVPTGQ